MNEKVDSDQATKFKEKLSLEITATGFSSKVTDDKETFVKVETNNIKIYIKEPSSIADTILKDLEEFIKATRANIDTLKQKYS